jgi:predicted XRE-type DNA-binding protein
MRVRRMLMDLVLEIVQRDQLNDYAIAHMCHTSRTRASTIVHGRIERLNSETLIDILARLGVRVDVSVVERRRYLRWELARPRPDWRLPRDMEAQTVTA